MKTRKVINAETKGCEHISSVIVEAKKPVEVVYVICGECWKKIMRTI